MSLPWGRRASRSVKEPDGEQMLPSSQFRLKLTLTRVDLHVGALYFIQSNLIWNSTHPCWKSNPSFLKFSWIGQPMAWHGNKHLDFLFLKNPKWKNIFYDHLLQRAYTDLHVPFIVAPFILPCLTTHRLNKKLSWAMNPGMECFPLLPRQEKPLSPWVSLSQGFSFLSGWASRSPDHRSWVV